MALTLLDILRKQQAAPGADPFAPGGVTPTPPPGGATAGIAQGIQAGSGAADTGNATGKVSAVPEMNAAADSKDLLAAGAQQAKTQQVEQNVQAAGITAGAQQASQASAERLANIAATARRQSDTLMADFENGQKSLRGDKDKAAAEQLGLNIRLANEKYVANLQNTAARDQITDEASFEKEFYEREFGASMDLFGDAQAFRTIMAADETQFAKDLGQIGINETLAAYKRMDATRRAQAPYSILSGVLGGAASYAGSPKSPSTPETPAEAEAGEISQAPGNTSSDVPAENYGIDTSPWSTPAPTNIAPYSPTPQG